MTLFWRAPFKQFNGGLSLVFLSFLMLLDGAWLATAAHAAPPYGATQCAASRFGSNLGCTANDVSINTITVVAGSIPLSCVGGQTLPLDLDVTLQFQSPTRYNIGVFVSSDGKNPQLLPASGGAAVCSVAVLPTTSPFLSLDGGSCGDGSGAINGGTGSGTFRMYGTNVPCITDGSGNATLSIPYLVSWDQNSNTNACSGNTYPEPGTTSKCNTGTVSFPPGSGIIVLPAISITDGVTTARSGDLLTYTVVITNTTASPLSAAIFTDPAVANLSVSSVSCSAAGGATCPSSPTVSAMQGSGITLPSMPNNSTLTFTVVGTVGNPTSPTTLTNTAQVTVSGQTNSASDTDTVMVAPTVAKSFSPSAIASGGTSTLTITLTNPNAVAITGAVFTDTYPSNMQNTTPLVLTNTCGGSTPAVVAGGELLSLSGGTIPANGSCAVSVLVRATATVVNNTGAVTSSNAASGSSASATLSMIGTVSSFNVFETSTAANATTGRIYTKLAGTVFGLDVVAIASGIQATGFSGNVKVELLANTNPGTNYGGTNPNCPNAFSIIQTIASAAISGGRSNVNTFTAGVGAYRDVRVRISYPTTSPTVTTCSTDSFAIRPQVFTITSTNATNAATSGTPVIKAGGDSFNLTATAVTGYNGTPSLDATKVIGSSTKGTLSGSFGAASSGVATGNTFTYSEVGNFGLSADAVYDTSFTSIDQGGDCVASSTSNALSSEKYGCWVGSNAVAQTTGSSGFGRFIPDHFNTTVLLSGSVPMPCPTGLTCPLSYNGFVYAGQPFSVQVTAKNASDDTTVNYNTTTGFAKSTALTAFGALGTMTAPTGTGTLGVASVTEFSAGTLTEPAEKYTFSTIPTAPTAIYIRASDGEASSLRASNPTTTSVEGGVHVVSGRMNIPNVYGSELLPLPMTVTVQYYSGTSWVTSATDSVTAFNTNLSTAGGNVVPTIVAGPLASGNISVVGAGAVTVAAGVKIFTLNKPGVTGSAGISLNAPIYLPTVTGRATFGIYKSPLIYRRENY